MPPQIPKTALVGDGSVRMVRPGFNEPVLVKKDAVERLLRKGYTFEGIESRGARAVQQKLEAEHGDELSGIQAFGEGGLDMIIPGASVGLFGESARKRAKVWPGQRLLGSSIAMGAGLLSGSATSTAVKLATGTTGTAFMAGEAAAGLVKGGGILTRGGAAALGGTIDTGLISVGQSITDASLTNKDITLESIAGDAVGGMALGGAAGFAAGAGVALVQTRRAAKQAAAAAKLFKEGELADAARDHFKILDDLRPSSEPPTIYGRQPGGAPVTKEERGLSRRKDTLVDEAPPTFYDGTKTAVPETATVEPSGTVLDDMLTATGGPKTGAHQGTLVDESPAGLLTQVDETGTFLTAPPTALDEAPTSLTSPPTLEEGNIAALRARLGLSSDVPTFQDIRSRVPNAEDLRRNFGLAQKGEAGTPTVVKGSPTIPEGPRIPSGSDLRRHFGLDDTIPDRAPATFLDETLTQGAETPTFLTEAPTQATGAATFLDDTLTGVGRPTLTGGVKTAFDTELDSLVNKGLLPKKARTNQEIFEAMAVKQATASTKNLKGSGPATKSLRGSPKGPASIGWGIDTRVPPIVTASGEIAPGISATSFIEAFSSGDPEKFVAAVINRGKYMNALKEVASPEGIKALEESEKAFLEAFAKRIDEIAGSKNVLSNTTMDIFAVLEGLDIATGVIPDEKVLGEAGSSLLKGAFVLSLLKGKVGKSSGFLGQLFRSAAGRGAESRVRRSLQKAGLSPDIQFAAGAAANLVARRGVGKILAEDITKLVRIQHKSEGRILRAAKMLGKGVGTTPPVLFLQQGFDYLFDDETKATITRETDPAKQFRARMEAINALVMSPSAMAAALTRNTAGLDLLHPEISEGVKQKVVEGSQLFVKQFPINPGTLKTFTGDKWVPNLQDMNKVNRWYTAFADPAGAIERFAAGRGTPEDADVLKKLYPEHLNKFTTALFSDPANLEKIEKSYKLRVNLSLLFKTPIDPMVGIAPQLQEHHRVLSEQAAQAGQAPQPQPTGLNQPTETQALQQPRINP